MYLLSNAIGCQKTSHTQDLLSTSSNGLHILTIKKTCCFFCSNNNLTKYLIKPFVGWRFNNLKRCMSKALDAKLI